MKTLRNIAFITLVILGLLYLFSPFGKNQDIEEWELEEHVLIESNIDSVYAYLSNSENASDWSSYIDHITPLNSDSILDGELGSLRRCFKQKTEGGIVWDEEIIKIQETPTLYRELSIFNLQNFPLQTTELTTRQHYHKLNNNSTQLTFGLYKSTNISNWTDVLKMKFTGYYISSIFKTNLSNIKAEIEKR